MDECQSLIEYLEGNYFGIGVGSDHGERSSRIQVGTTDPQKLDGKNQQEVIHWHTRYSQTKYMFSGNFLAYGVNIIEVNIY